MAGFWHFKQVLIMGAYSQQALDKSRHVPSVVATDGLQLVCELAGFEVAESKQRRALKGTVAVQSDSGWLRLRWSWGRKRYTMAIGLPDTKINRIVAERRAKLIEQDIATDQFDPTLSKYRRIEQREDSIEVVELFDRFSQFKAKSLDAHSTQKYAGLMGHLRQFFRKA
jgi:integrase